MQHLGRPPQHHRIRHLVARQLGDTPEVLPDHAGVDGIGVGVRRELVSRRAEVRQIRADCFDQQLQTVGRDPAFVPAELIGHPIGKRPALLQWLAVDRVAGRLLQILQRGLPAAASAVMRNDRAGLCGHQQCLEVVPDRIGLGHYQDAARAEQILPAGLGQAQPHVRGGTADLFDDQVRVLPLPRPHGVGHGPLDQERVGPRQQNQRHLGSSEVDSAAMKASCGTSTRPTIFIRFLPSFCFSSSLRLRVMSPP